MADETEETAPFRTFETEDDFNAAVSEAVDKAASAAVAKGRAIGQRRALSDLGVTADDITELKALRAERAAAEDERAKAEGRWLDLEKNLKGSHAEKEAAWSKREAAYRERIRRDGARTALLEAVGTRAVAPSQVVDLLQHRIGMTDDADMTPQVVNPDGTPALDGSNAVTVQSVVDQFFADPTNAHHQAGGQTTGSGSRGSGTPATGDRAELAEIQKQREAIFDEENADQYEQVARLDKLDRQEREIRDRIDARA